MKYAVPIFNASQPVKIKKKKFIKNTCNDLTIYLCVCFQLTFVEVHARDQVQEQLLLDRLDFEGPFQL